VVKALLDKVDIEINAIEAALKTAYRQKNKQIADLLETHLLLKKTPTVQPGFSNNKKRKNTGENEETNENKYYKKPDEDNDSEDNKKKTYN